MGLLAPAVLLVCLAASEGGVPYEYRTHYGNHDCNSGCVTAYFSTGHCDGDCYSCGEYLGGLCSSSCLNYYHEHHDLNFPDYYDCYKCKSFVYQYLSVTTTTTTTTKYKRRYRKHRHCGCRRRCVKSYFYNEHCGSGCGRCESYLHNYCSHDCVTYYNEHHHFNWGCYKCKKFASEYLTVTTKTTRVTKRRYKKKHSYGCRRRCVKGYFYNGHCGGGCGRCKHYLHNYCSHDCVDYYNEHHYFNSGCYKCKKFTSEYLKVTKTTEVTKKYYRKKRHYGCRRRCVKGYFYNGHCGSGCGRCKHYLHNYCSHDCVDYYNEHHYFNSGCYKCKKFTTEYLTVTTKTTKVTKRRYKKKHSCGCRRRCVKGYFYNGHCGSGCGRCKHYLHNYCSHECVDYYNSHHYFNRHCYKCKKFTYEYLRTTTTTKVTKHYKGYKKKYLHGCNKGCIQHYFKDGYCGDGCSDCQSYLYSVCPYNCVSYYHSHHSLDCDECSGCNSFCSSYLTTTTTTQVTDYSSYHENHGCNKGCIQHYFSDGYCGDGCGGCQSYLYSVCPYNCINYYHSHHSLDCDECSSCNSFCSSYLTTTTQVTQYSSGYENHGCNKGCIQHYFSDGYCGDGCGGCQSYLYSVCPYNCINYYHSHHSLDCDECSSCNSFCSSYLTTTTQVTQYSSSYENHGCNKGCIQHYFSDGYCGDGCGGCETYLYSVCPSTCVSYYKSHHSLDCDGCSGCNSFCSSYLDIQVQVSSQKTYDDNAYYDR